VRFVLPLFILAFAVTATRADAAPRTCLTASPSPAEGQQAFLETTDAAGRYVQSCPPGGAIAVAFHVLHSGDTGRLTSEQVLAQMTELNLDFAPSGFQFVLAALDYTDNDAWFNQSIANATPIRLTLAIDPAHTLNLYSCNLPGLGFSLYPWQLPESSYQNCVFVSYLSLPGVGPPPFNLGRTATHEVGHYLGLYHTFENGCAAPGDFVADTPDEARPETGCPIGADTCPSPGLDPIHNYMDYSDDACYTEFTPDQWARMCAMVATYRPSLLTGGITPARGATWGEIKVHYR